MRFSHSIIERNAILLAVLALITVSIGGIVQIVPLFTIESTIERVSGVRPYSPLEQIGRDVYIREGCYLCHSQQIRPFRDEVERYGHYSLAAESVYDHPFQWGSKRTGPDLARIGGKYSNAWHSAHLMDPKSVVPTSIMPRFGFLARPVRTDDLTARMKTLRMVGVPYTEEMIAKAKEDLQAQIDPDGDSSGLLARYPNAVVASFTGTPPSATPTEMDAVIAYLQVLGTMVSFQNVPLENLKQ